MLTRLPSFNNESMVTQLMHVANCYLFWLSKSVMQQQRPYFKEEEHSDLIAVCNAYRQVDLLVNEFLQNFKDSLEQQRGITRPMATHLYGRHLKYSCTFNARISP